VTRTRRLPTDAHKIQPWAQSFPVAMATGRLIELHVQEALRGQQDVPWLRRRGSKNSRKLLYFVEWAQECKMSAVSFLHGWFFLGSEPGHMLAATALKITPPCLKLAFCGTELAHGCLCSPTSESCSDRPATGTKPPPCSSEAGTAHLPPEGTDVTPDVTLLISLGG